MTRRSSTVALLVASATLCACQTNEPPGVPAVTEQPAPSTPSAETERLLAQPPDGWVATFASNHPGTRLAEYVPAGETAETWVEKVSFESFVATPLPDPIEMLIGIAADQKKTCTGGFTDFNTFSGIENGYATSIRLFICRNNPLFQQGQVTLMKAIRGNEQFYVVTRARRVPPIESETLPIGGDDMAAWSLYLRAISLCDASRTDHPCPKVSSLE